MEKAFCARKLTRLKPFDTEAHSSVTSEATLTISRLRRKSHLHKVPHEHRDNEKLVQAGEQRRCWALPADGDTITKVDSSTNQQSHAPTNLFSDSTGPVHETGEPPPDDEQ